MGLPPGFVVVVPLALSLVVGASAGRPPRGPPASAPVGALPAAPVLSPLSQV
ncbi:MAG: hypothetical protein ACRDHP_19395 [Ktedonobacterales bacterium]